MYKLLERKSSILSGFIVIQCEWDITGRNRRIRPIYFYMCILLENDKIRLLHFFSSEHDITFEAFRKTTQTTGRCIKETEYCISKIVNKKCK